jgi:thymidine phosphorylase
VPAGGAAPRFDAVDLIRAKRDGGELSAAEISWLIDAYVAGAVPDEQVASWLMAVYQKGMSAAETSSLTGAMVASGDVIDLSGLARPTVDKHSTGGVGDKVSLVLVPLLAALGAAVPQLSGRGLGHTGGTLDKLEAIPGWRSNLSVPEVLAQLGSVGCVICAAGASLAPADRKLYALRDVTATVESVPLIASSIMSKKIAEGTSALVLDVKVGSGAFMAKRDRAAELATAMVEIGRDRGMKVAALLTSMDVPIGRAVGNALEVAEAVDTLEGRGPGDLVEVTVALAQVMLELAGLDGHPVEALHDGSALAAWKAMVRAQGGDPDAPLPAAPVVEPVVAERSGSLGHLDARAVGVAAWRLGAGRARKEDPVSAGAGVRCLVKPGEPVEKGQPLLELHTDDAGRLERARESLSGALEIVDEPPVAGPGSLVLERIG